jgi:hypothetical protein
MVATTASVFDGPRHAMNRPALVEQRLPTALPQLNRAK